MGTSAETGGETTAAAETERAPKQKWGRRRGREWVLQSKGGEGGKVARESTSLLQSKVENVRGNVENRYPTTPAARPDIRASASLVNRVQISRFRKLEQEQEVGQSVYNSENPTKQGKDEPKNRRGVGLKS